MWPAEKKEKLMDDYVDFSGLTFDEIAEEYGLEAAIQAGIAADPDTWELTEEDFAQMRPVSEDFRSSWRLGAPRESPTPAIRRPPKTNSNSGTTWTSCATTSPTKALTSSISTRPSSPTQTTTSSSGKGAASSPPPRLPPSKTLGNGIRIPAWPTRTW